MTEDEFQLIDNLYFVTGYQDLAVGVGLKDEVLRKQLWQLMKKGWIKCLLNPEDEIWPGREEFEKNFTEYHYLATKQGLFAHNER